MPLIAKSLWGGMLCGIVAAGWAGVTYCMVGVATQQDPLPHAFEILLSAATFALGLKHLIEWHIQDYVAGRIKQIATLCVMLYLEERKMKEHENESH